MPRRWENPRIGPTPFSGSERNEQHMILVYGYFAIYVGLCFLAAQFGRKRRIGMNGFFIIALLGYPLVALFLLLIPAPARQPRDEA